MTIIKKSFVFAGMLLDIIYLIKWLKKYRWFKNKIELLKKIELLNVSDAKSIFKGVPNGEKKYLAIKGILQAKSEDKTILSLLIDTPINKNDPLNQHLFDRLPYPKIFPKAQWIRPQKLESVDFVLKDQWNSDYLSVSSLKGTDFSGALTEGLSQVNKSQPSKNVVQSLLQVFDSLSNIFPFSLFKMQRKTDWQTSYYAIMHESYSVVVGNFSKNSGGDLIIQKPEIVTKQLSFVLKRMKKTMKKYQIFIFAFLLFQLYLLFKIGKQISKKFKLDSFFQEYEEQDQDDIPPHHECIICFTSPRSVIFKPCKHYGLCYQCYRRLGKKECPVCKKGITGVIRVIKKKAFY